MTAIVIYDTTYGNTEVVAKALARGLARHGEVDCLNIRDVDADRLPGPSLVAVGAPTIAFSASQPMKDFLAKLKGKSLAGSYGFAFETRVSFFFSGSAAKHIEKTLRDLGAEIIHERASAIVKGKEHSVLQPGEEARFEALGDEIGGAWARRTTAAQS